VRGVSVGKQILVNILDIVNTGSWLLLILQVSVGPDGRIMI